MPEPNEPPPTGEPPPPAVPEPVITKKNPARLSLVWLVPIVAVVIGAGLLINSLMQAGPHIVISFRTAEGLESGKTEVRYKEVVVGRVESVTLSDDRQRVLVGVRLDRSAGSIAVQDTYFWVVRPRIGTAGISGLGTLLSGAYIGVDAGTSSESRRQFGGIAFQHLPNSEALAPAPDGTRFYLFEDRKNALAPPDGPPLTIRMVYEHSVRGLSVGAPVDFLGVEIGTVRSLAPQYDAPHRRYPVEVTAAIYPLRLGKVREAILRGAPPDPATDVRLLKALVANGLRAQLRTGNLLSGQQYVALDFNPKAPPAPLDPSQPVPLVPTVPGTFSEIQPQIAEIVAKINKVPFDEIARDLQGTLAQARNAIGRLSPEAQKALADVQRTLGSVQESLNRLDRNLLDETAPLQRNVEQTMIELQRAAQSLRVLGDYLQRHPEAILRGKRADPAVGGAERQR